MFELAELLLQRPIYHLLLAEHFLLALPLVESFPSQVVVLSQRQIRAKVHLKAFSFLAEFRKSVEGDLASLWPFVCISSVLKTVHPVRAVVVVLFCLLRLPSIASTNHPRRSGAADF
jgi:hypothetical protein